MQHRRYLEVDVFTPQPYRGNPLAVVLDGTGLSTEEMQRFANWTNFSETTFRLPPSDEAADYAVRIFTTSAELPFAGHPTLGSCHAWLSNGGTPRNPDEVVQECGVGLVRVRRDGSLLAFAAPPLRREGDVSFEDPVTGSLNASMAQWLVNSGRVTPPYQVSQGTALGRAGEVHVAADETGQLWIGGAVTTCVEGTVLL